MSLGVSRLKFAEIIIFPSAKMIRPSFDGKDKTKVTIQVNAVKLRLIQCSILYNKTVRYSILPYEIANRVKNFIIEYSLQSE